MTTFGELIDDTRNHLMTGQPDRLNRLSGSMDASTTLVTLADSIVGIKAGTQIAVGLEVLHVLSVSSQDLTVLRGAQGSTAQSHDSSEPVWIAPQFTDFHIAQKVNSALQSLTTMGLFQVRTLQFTYIPTRIGFDLPATDLLDIQSVRFDTPGPTREWKLIPKHWWRLDQAADTDDFPSGFQLNILQGGFPGHDIKVTYRSAYTQFPVLDTARDNDVTTTTGLHAEAHDIPPLHAAVRLSSGRDTKRTFLNRQPEPRRQGEVPPGAATNAINPLATQLLIRANEEAARLQRRYPTHG